MRIFTEINGTPSLDIKIKDDMDIHSPIIKEQKKFSNEWVKGEQELIYTNGLCILYHKFTVIKNFINFFSIEKEYIQLSLLFNGNSQVLKKENKFIKDIKAGVLQLAYQEKNNIKVRVSNDSITMNYIRIFISKEYFLVLLKNEIWFTESTLHKKISDSEYINFGEIILPVNFSILNIFSEIINNSNSGVLGHSYYHLKLKELILMIFINFSAKLQTTQNIKLIEIEKIEMAKAYLNTHYEAPPTIRQLSRIVHLNELKLKTSFKSLYKYTIHNYIIKLRMEQANVLLFQGYPVNEIALTIGYKSTSHFIASFKKFYGKTPKQFINSSISN
ncbi:AraC family transcriptional regulator [Apibacter raozihei]|uniref:helix-turn-helix domain-containing protein n=1 Tax=Apibacter raozihei TaxID=2500547 RepID=UPI000FE37178|nr:AraC family transcriptional regulator [Apibacter raozihei]